MIQKASVVKSMGITQIKEWYRRFKDGRISVDSDPRSGRPSLTTTPENIERVRLAIEGDRRLTIQELENDLGIPEYRSRSGLHPETKRQSSQWKRPDEPRPKKARQSRSHVKSMLIIFFRL